MIFNLGTTGIGSHPLNNPKQVILDIFDSKITYPYIPQVYSDEMIFQFHNEFPGLSIQKGSVILDLNTPDFEIKLKKFKEILKLKSLLLQPHGIQIKPESYKSLFIFSNLLNKSSKHWKGIKCQLTGPITEAASIKIYPSNIKLIQNSELLDLSVNLTSEIAYWLSSYLSKMANSNNISKSNVILF
ncbi:MAG: hypothetical protein ACFFD2_14440, partial [Promethearchaeota archaeon]